MNEEVVRLRRSGIRLIVIGGWVTCAALLALSFSLGAPAVQAALASALLNIIPTFAARAGHHDLQARLSAAIMVAMQPALLLYAMQGAAWQIDMHMYFFVALASLTILCDVGSIILACLLVALHHLVLAYTASSWVFSGGGALSRVLVHALAVVLQGGILCFIAMKLKDAMKRLRTTRDQIAEFARESRQLAAEAQAALRNAEKERKAREQYEINQAKVRQSDFARISNQFETSIREVTQAVSQTAKMLEDSTRAIDRVALQAGDQARDLAHSAEHASRATQAVANGVTELSQSISNIAVNVTQQNQLTEHATERSSSGGKAVSNLSDRSETISEATDLIVRIAEQTTLLSLNAAIEAASAGEAGRGFSVVAQEVKTLAYQATEAASEINDLLTGVHSGTVQAEQSFSAIDGAISELSSAASAILSDVETQKSSANVIEDHASLAAQEVNDMARRSRSLADKAQDAKKLSSELELAAALLIENVKTLETSTELFVTHLHAA